MAKFPQETGATMAKFPQETGATMAKFPQETGATTLTFLLGVRGRLTIFQILGYPADAKKT